MLINPQEDLLQEARALQQSDYCDQHRRRVVAEHRLARLEQLGIRQARYFGRAKAKFQLHLAARVANLTLLANQNRWVRRSWQRRRNRRHPWRSSPPDANLNAGLARLTNAGDATPQNQGFPARFPTGLCTKVRYVAESAHFVLWLAY